MVGDENQSIYRFRNADLEVFRGERRDAERLCRSATLLPLLGNFRSLPAVLAGINEVGRTLLDGFSELSIGRTDEGEGAVELLLTLDEGRGKDARKWAQEEIDLDPPPGGSPPRVVAEARFLAAAAARDRRRRRGGARRDRRPPARLHPRRRLRGGAATAPGCGRSWSVGAATGRSSRWRT